MLTKPNAGKKRPIISGRRCCRAARRCSSRSGRCGGVDNAQVAVLDLRSRTQHVLVRGASDARYVASGHLLFAAGGGLRSVAFDIGSPSP